MAHQGKRLDEQTQRMITRLRQNGVSVRNTAKHALVSPQTVQKYFPPLICPDCNSRKSGKIL